MTVTSSDRESGARRHMSLSKRDVWAQVLVFAEFDEDAGQRIYVVGGNHADNGLPEHGLVV